MAAHIGLERGTYNKFKTLAQHPLIEEIENIGMDEGRFFVHLKEGYKFKNDGHCVPPDFQTTRSFGSVKEARIDLAKVERI